MWLTTYFYHLTTTLLGVFGVFCVDKWFFKALNHNFAYTVFNICSLPILNYGDFYKLLCGDFEDFVRQIDDLNEGAVRAL